VPLHDDQARIERGLNLVYDSAILPDYEDSPALRGHLLSVLAVHPRSVGIGLAQEGLLVLDGRKMFIRGTGEATFLLMANERRSIRVQTIVERHPQSPRPERDLIDLTEWRRDAIDRTLEPFPPETPETPFVQNGTLVIVGGGGMPRGLMERFIELAGGKEHARLVYVPCSEADDLGDKHATVEAWKKLGVKHATFLHTKNRDRANGDEAFLEPLQHATGIWFGGGRQWNFADSYYGTTAHKLMKEVLQRGGVIGGSSAGASIQARYLARATPIGNFRIMAPGYERGGLGFLGGVAIDQHFSQRRRQQDMTELMAHHPQLLGIGIDEATGLIVRKSIADIVGRGKVHFYDRNLPVFPGQPDFIALPDGSCYDLAERRILNDTSIWFAPPLRAEKPAVLLEKE
jgi:cyanophycinase